MTWLNIQLVVLKKSDYPLPIRERSYQDHVLNDMRFIQRAWDFDRD